MSKPMLTYFIQRQSGGAIKIGRSVQPRERLRALQTSHDEPLVLLATFHEDIEAALHERFKHLRLQGEWFRDDAELVDFVCARPTISDEDRKRLRRRTKPIPIAELAPDSTLPLEEKFCEVVVDLHDEADRWDLLELFDQYGPEIDESEHETEEEMLDEVDECGCDFHTWQRGVMTLIECDVIARVGINDDQGILFLALKPINSDRRTRQIEEALTSAAWDFDACGWSLYGHGFHARQRAEVDIDFLMLSLAIHKQDQSYIDEAMSMVPPDNGPHSSGNSSGNPAQT